jgi:hypothetical protein
MPKTKSYPDFTLEEALVLPNGIFEIGSTNEVRRLTAFDHIKKAPESGPSRTLISTCNKYGLIKGSAASETLSVTELGRDCVSPDVTEAAKARARFQSGITAIEEFRTLHQKYCGTKMPARAVLLDELESLSVSEKDREAVADRFVENCNFTGVVRVLSGAERIIPIEQVIEELGGEKKAVPSAPAIEANAPVSKLQSESSPSDFSKICFYITAIGDENSEERQHSDLFLSSIVEPAIEPLGLSVVRADKIAEPGMITTQVIEHIFRSRLVVADLSFHNPNVFYELALRHIARLPTVQIVRKGDRIPFDINQFRTVVIDCSSIYSLVPKLDSYRTDIRNHSRSALDDPSTANNPVVTSFPGVRVDLRGNGG